MAIIKPKHGTTAPSSGLTQYELAVDTTNKRVYIGKADGSGDLIGSTPGGADTQVQFNSSGNFGGSVNFIFDGTNLQIGSQGDLRLADSDSSNYVAFQAPATVTNNNIYTLPSAVGSANQVLQIASVAGNDATLQWATVSGGGGTPGGSDTQVQFNDGGSTFGGDSGLTYNKTTDSLTITGDLAVNGGDITTSTTTATIFNTTATTVSAFGAATTCTLGYSGSSTSTTNIATTGPGLGQVKTINIGTGGNRETVVNINNGGLSSAIYLNGNTYIGAAGSASPAILFVDTIQNYSSTIGITTGGSGGVTIDDTASIRIGDFSANGDGTLLSVKDGSQAVQVSALNGLHLQAQTQLRFYEADDTNYVGFKAPATVAADKMWTLPSADGTTGQVLKTDGAGTLSWVTAGGTAAGSDTQVQFNDGGSAFGGDAGLTYSKTTDTLSIGLTSSAGILNMKGQGELRFNDADSSNYVAFKSAATVSSNVTWTLPATDGTGGQMLSTDGSGTLSWATPPGAELALFNLGII